jgi:RNA polymerase sigma factor (sigma-70 family)
MMGDANAVFHSPFEVCRQEVTLQSIKPCGRCLSLQFLSDFGGSGYSHGVHDQTDAQLLQAYAEHHSEPAFAELVRRHVDLVHSAARRMVGDAHLAQDVSQATFVALAKSAAQLIDRPVLAGWLHRTAQNIAAQTVRTDVRRRAREQKAVAMNELLTAEPDVSWEQIAPHLDAALGELTESDHDILLLSYFERDYIFHTPNRVTVFEGFLHSYFKRGEQQPRAWF